MSLLPQLGVNRPCRDLFPNYLSKRLIDPVLPARSGFLKMIKNVSVNSQRDKLLGIRDSRTFRREFRGLRGGHLERSFGRIPRGGGPSCSVGRHFVSSRGLYFLSSNWAV